MLRARSYQLTLCHIRPIALLDFVHPQKSHFHSNTSFLKTGGGKIHFLSEKSKTRVNPQILGAELMHAYFFEEGQKSRCSRFLPGKNRGFVGLRKVTFTPCANSCAQEGSDGAPVTVMLKALQPPETRTLPASLPALCPRRRPRARAQHSPRSCASTQTSACAGIIQPAR
jgi:hypothetical protein